MTLRPLLALPLALSALACEQTTVGAASAQAPALGENGFIERFQALDEGVWFVSDGWSNGDWVASDWRREQVATGRDGLTITLEKATGGDKPYTGGELQRVGRFHHGYFEIDMRPPRGSGLVSGFFTYTGPYYSDPHDEIDIEILGRDTRQVELTTWKDAETTSHTVVPLGFDAADDFHLYAFEWTEDYVRWFVDGALIHEERAEDTPLPQSPQIAILSLWNSDSLTDWVGPIDAEGAPWTMTVACVAQAERYEGRPLCRDP